MLRGVFKAPASSANIGPGYDIFSLALARPYLRLELSVGDGSGIHVENTGKYGAQLHQDPCKHAGAVAASNLLKHLGLEKRVELIFEANIPPRKGLGASGAEAAAAVYGLSTLLGLKFTKAELVKFAASAEPGGHADNVSASLLGGFVILLHNNGGPEAVRITPLEDLGMIVVVPDFEKESTAAARKALPEMLEVRRHVAVASRTAVAAAALALSDLDLFLKAVYLDPFVEVARATAGVYGPWLDGEKLVEEKQRLFKLYHVAEVISGAGPSRLLLYKKSENRGDYGGRPVDEALQEVLEGVEAGGGRVLEVFETVADLYGCTPI